MSLAYHEAAREELLEAVAYYEVRAAGLGRRLLNEVLRVERAILEQPDAGERVRAGLRRRLLRKFPYSLIYALEPDGPLVLAVAHHRRRPGFWIGRTDPS